jgi:hypothetical protein
MNLTSIRFNFEADEFKSNVEVISLIVHKI